MIEAGSGLDWRIGRRSLLRAGALGGAGLAAAALIGCGSDDNTSKPSGSATAAGTGAQGTATAAAQPGVTVSGKLIPFNFPDPPGKTPKSGGTLVVAETWDVSVLDPTKSAAGGTIATPNTTSNRLLGYKRGPQADPFKLELVPELAKTWENTPDGLTYTFKLQPNVKWQNVAPLNGRAFKAADVKYAYDRYAAGGAQQPYFTNVKSVDAVDDSTLKVTLKSPQPDFLIPLGGRYTTIFAKELVDSGEIDKKSIGTGPMILQSAVQGQAVEFTKNPDYWAGAPYLDGMKYLIQADSAAETAAFRAGQIDFGAVVGTTVQSLDPLLKTNPNIQVNAAQPVNATFAISFNLQNPRWQDERIRQGISLAMDRNEIIKIVFTGLGVSLPTFPWIFLFDKEPTVESGLLGKWWKTDLAQSKQLLQAAGQENLTIDMPYYNYGDSSNKSQNEILTDQMRKAGITLKPLSQDYTTFNSQWTAGKSEGVADGWAAQGFDTDNFFYQHMRSDSAGNRWHISDPEIDQWADQQRVELNPQRRREILRKIWDKSIDKMYRIEKPAGTAFTVYQPWLRGFRSVGVLGSNSYFYDWGAQAKETWLDK